MKKYEVTVCYEGCLKMEIEASSEEEAENIAEKKFNKIESKTGSRFTLD